MSIERRGSRANLSATNNFNEEVRRKTPSRQPSGFAPINSLVEAATPDNKSRAGPLGIVLELLRLIVRKLHDIEHSMSVENSRHKRPSNGLIAISEKSMQLPPKVESMELPNIDSLLERL